MGSGCRAGDSAGMSRRILRAVATLLLLAAGTAGVGLVLNLASAGAVRLAFAGEGPGIQFGLLVIGMMVIAAAGVGVVVWLDRRPGASPVTPAFSQAMLDAGRVVAVAAALFGLHRLLGVIVGRGDWRDVALGLALVVLAPVFLWDWGRSMNLIEKEEKR